MDTAPVAVGSRLTRAEVEEAFDAGWIAVTDDDGVIVEDAPEREGYDKWKQSEGESPGFPGDSSIRPHPEFANCLGVKSRGTLA